jgi:hypothetical protein
MHADADCLGRNVEGGSASIAAPAREYETPATSAAKAQRMKLYACATRTTLKTSTTQIRWPPTNFLVHHERHEALHLACGRRAPALQHRAMLGEQAA